MSRSLLLKTLLAWYVIFSVTMAIAPANRQFWAIASVLPVLLVVWLVATHRALPLSSLSYVLITLYLTLHTIGVHYTYSQVPLGMWLGQVMDLNRNHFDRIVHFSFGFLLTYPLEELFRMLRVRGWLAYYLPVMTILGLSGLWEIVESWVAQLARPDLGPAVLGSQGDVWDAQKDMTVAFYGSLLSVLLTVLFRRLAEDLSEVPDSMSDEDLSFQVAEELVEESPAQQPS
jgi:putative membrane protein